MPRKSENCLRVCEIALLLMLLKERQPDLRGVRLESLISLPSARRGTRRKPSPRVEELIEAAKKVARNGSRGDPDVLDVVSKGLRATAALPPGTLGRPQRALESVESGFSRPAPAALMDEQLAKEIQEGFSAEGLVFQPTKKGPISPLFHPHREDFKIAEKAPAGERMEELRETACLAGGPVMAVILHQVPNPWIKGAMAMGMLYCGYELADVILGR